MMTDTFDNLKPFELVYGWELIDLYNQANIGVDSKIIENEQNGFPFYFKDLRDNSYIFFRAFLEGITEEIAPSWAEHNYMGRSEPTYN